MLDIPSWRGATVMSRLNPALALALALLSIVAAPARAEDGQKGAASVRFLTELGTVSLTIDMDPLAAWLKPVIAEVESRFPKMANRKSIVVQVTLRSDGPAEVELAGNPGLSAEDVAALAESPGFPAS